MNTLKSAALIAVLLGVLYGVYVALNKPAPPAQSAPPAGDLAPPLVEFGSSKFSPASAPSAPPPLARDDFANSAAAASRSPRGGSFQPNLDTGSLPPPPTTIPPAAPPLNSATATASGGLQRSAYETSAANPASESSASGYASLTPPAPETTPPSSPASAAATAAAPALAAYSLRRDLTECEQLVAENKFRAALARLTPHYASADLTAEQRTLLHSWLDALAAKVIYSREHLLASPHQVRKGQDLYQIAHQYNVEYRLLQNINREVTDPMVVVPGTELKVVPGPFRADVNLTTGEITLLVDELYAGRFPFMLGDQPPQPGDYKVVDKKSQQKTYIGFDGRVILANDANNPYGGWWISLGGETCIHGSPAAPSDRPLGCISLSPRDAQDAYGILSVGSEVKIRK